MIERIITGDLGVNTYLYNYSEKNIVIIDPGADSENIITKINNKELIPTAIFLTHGHFDHIGAVSELKQKFNIKVYIHTGDSTFLGNEGEVRHLEMFSSMGANGLYYFKNYYKKNDSADFELADKDFFEDYSLKVVHTPGHSPGSVCFYSEKYGIIFTGDTMFKNGVGRTDFVGGDYNILLNSLNLLKTLPKDTIVYPGHGDSTTIGSES